MRKYLNTKGSAMMMVLCSMMILIAVSSVVIMLSTANITMSKKYSNWSEDYYQLDYVAEDQLATLDKSVLIPAENLSRYYLQNDYYQYEQVSDFPTGVEANSTAASINDFLGSAPDLQRIIHDKWAELTSLDEDSNPEQQIQTFVNDLFKFLYYAYIDKNTISINKTNTYSEYNIESKVALTSANWFPSSSYSFDSMCSRLVIPKVSIKAKELGVENPKMVDALIDLNPPAFKAVEQKKYYAVKANPLYANALSVQGGITFQGAGTVSITGDVVSNNLNKSGATLGLEEGNQKGIQALNATSVKISGNVYSGGDLHLWGSHSSISVSPYLYDFSNSLLLKRNYLYSTSGTEKKDNEYFLDFTVSTDIPSYWEEASGTQLIPYIYQDCLGGNVYCNNLSIEEVAEYGTLTVSGNVWTQDDIQNDAMSAQIKVEKNYIGMRSDANETNKDPNGSSSVINNGYMYGSSIAIGDQFIIPGTAFFKFGNNQYYQTAESGTARAGEYFDLYQKNILDEGTSKVFGNYQDMNLEDNYDLFEQESATSANALIDRITRFQEGLKALKAYDSEHIKSGITVGTNKSNYTLGVVNNEGSILYDSASSQYMANYTRYKEASATLLPNVFASKTKFYGTSQYAFSDLIEDSGRKDDSSKGFYYYPSNQTFTLTGMHSGILYCDGDLTLNGTGTFRGSIICAGNLTVNSGVTIQYDESKVREVLGFTDDYKLNQSVSETSSHIARQFFSPSKYAAFKTIGVETIPGTSSSAGERENTSRYTINMWKEAKAL